MATCQRSRYHRKHYLYLFIHLPTYHLSVILLPTYLSTSVENCTKLYLSIPTLGNIHQAYPSSFSEHYQVFLLVQFSSIAQLCPILCDPMDCSMPGFPVHHQLPKLAQTHVHRVSDGIQPSHPLSTPKQFFFFYFLWKNRREVEKIDSDVIWPQV